MKSTEIFLIPDLHKPYAISELGIIPVTEMLDDEQIKPLTGDSILKLYSSVNSENPNQNQLVLRENQTNYRLPLGIPNEIARQVTDISEGHDILPFRVHSKCPQALSFSNSVSRN